MRLIYLALASSLLLGCGGEEFQDLRDFVKNSGADMRGKIDPPPDVKPYEYFSYNNEENLPNPFQPRKEKSKSGGGGINQPDFDRPKEALEEFPLESLKMVASLQQKNKWFAVIRATDGTLHRVTVGNHMGLNFGLIKEVTDTSVLIRELVQDSGGDWTERENTLQIME